MSHTTATYRVITDAGGMRYRFFCDLSGAAVCTSRPIQADTPEELMLAWEHEGRPQFNQCHKCGRWVIDAMYNPDTLECVDCSPWLPEPAYCEKCGARLTPNENYCRRCGWEISRIGVDADVCEN